MKIALSSQPESNKRLLKRSLKLYSSTFKRAFLLSLLLSLIFFLPRIIFIASGNTIFINSQMVTPSDFVQIVLNMLVLFIFTTILWHIRCVVMDTHESVLKDFDVVSKKILTILAAVIIQMFIISMISFVAFYFFHFMILEQEVVHLYIAIGICVMYFVVWIYLLFLFIFYLPLILNEKEGFISSLIKSATLVWGNWWRVFLLQVTPILCYFLCWMLLKELFQIKQIAHFIDNLPQGWIIPAVLNIIILAFFVPWNATVLLIQLRDLELRQ